MSEEQTEEQLTQAAADEAAAQEQAAAAALAAAQKEERTRAETADWAHEDAAVDESDDESFPASDPPAL